MVAQRARVDWNAKIEETLQKMAGTMVRVGPDAQGRSGAYTVLPASSRSQILLIKTLEIWGVIVQEVGRLSEENVEVPIGERLRELYTAANDGRWQGAVVYWIDPEAFEILSRCFADEKVPKLMRRYEHNRWVLGPVARAEHDIEPDFPFPVHIA